MGLHPGNVLQDIPVGDGPNFWQPVLKGQWQLSATDFRALGWIHSPKARWNNLTLYILVHFGEDQERLRLHEAIRATCNDIQMSVANFYAIFELYYPATGTFFIPVGKRA